MKRLLLTLFLIFLTYQNSFSQWEEVNITSENLYDVHFVNDSIGWIVGNNTILKTIDGGDNWMAQNPPVSDTRYYGVHFKDTLNGWAFGKKATASTAGRIHYTNDGGTTWQVYFTGGSLPWWSMDFADNENGVIVGQEGQILYTNDGGQTWGNRTSPSGDVGTINDVQFYDDTNGIAVGGSGGNGFIIKTNDSGNSWTNVNTSNLTEPLGNLKSVSFLGSDNGIAVGISGKVYKTFDGGTSWFIQDSGSSSSYLQAVHHINIDDVIAVGSSGTIITSNIGGIFWDDEDLESTAYLRGVHFNTQNSGWVVGSFGAILRYKTDPLLKVFNEIEKFGSNDPVRSELDYFLLSVSADGSSATVFENGFFGHENQIFKIMEDPNGESPDEYGSFTNIESTTSSEYTEVRYNHPKYLDLNNEQSLTIHIGIFDPGETEPNFEFPINIVKPPVLMTHGLWSNGADAFGNMKNALLQTGMYYSYQLRHFNYTNDAFVFENAPILNFEKNKLKDLCLKNNHSTGKVDLFGHSMGGLISRFYIQSNQYENDVNKLITFNTPHSGSQWADLMLDPSFYFLPQILTDLNHNPTNGAIDNLRVEGSFINSLNTNSDSANYDNIGLHSVVTTETTSGLALEYAKITALAIARHTRIVDFTMKHFLFNNEIHDLIVPFSSQVGGVEFSAYTSQWHSSTGAPNANVLAKAIELVNKKAGDVAFFDNFGYSPAELEYNLNYQRSENNSSNETLTIANPIEATEYNSGDEVSITVNGSSGVSSIITSMGSANTPIQTYLSENTSTDTVLLTIPENTLGRLEIVAMGFDQNGYADYDTTYINVTTNAILESIEIEESIIYVAENNNTSIRVIGHYSDGIERDVTSVSNLTYSFSNNNASNTESGFINGINEGDDVLTVTLDGKVDSVPIIITSQSEVYDITLSIDEVINNDESISIYPNPTKSVLNIKTNKSVDNVTVFDITGKQLFSRKGTKSINVSELQNGIYIVRIKSENNIISKRFIKN